MGENVCVIIITVVCSSLEHRCKKEKSLFKNKPLHHKYSTSLCYIVYLSTIFDFFCLTECSKLGENPLYYALFSKWLI